jgi:NTE family protein
MAPLHAPPDVAFVLSGGASLGAVQAGMLRALYERGIRPDVVVGTSAGALNGAFIASRPQTAGTAGELADVWRGLRRGQVFPLNPLTGLLGFLGKADHLVPESGLRRLIERHVETDRLELLPIPLHVVAVDVVSGEELLLSRGSLVDAVLASAAIPAVLPPVEWGYRMLMDGGVANNTPISHAVALGARRIYVLPTGHACMLEEPPDGALGMALHAISLLTHRRLIEDIERHRDDAQLIVLPPPCPLSVTPVDFSRADELIDRALTDARAFLNSGGEERPAIRMHMHAHRGAQSPPGSSDAERGTSQVQVAGGSLAGNEHSPI